MQDQLDNMVQKYVLDKIPVGESYQWCHPMVVVSKKDRSEPRITVDLTGSNKYVKWHGFGTLVPRDVVAGIPRWMKYLFKARVSTGSPR